MTLFWQVTPGRERWNDFLDLSCQYITRYWPKALTERAQETCRREYEIDLRLNCTNGGGGLFVALLETRVIGIANVYD